MQRDIDDENIFGYNLGEFKPKTFNDERTGEK